MPANLSAKLAAVGPEIDDGAAKPVPGVNATYCIFSNVDGLDSGADCEGGSGHGWRVVVNRLRFGPLTVTRGGQQQAPCLGQFTNCNP